MPYTASDGKKYERDFTTDQGLYLIAQQLRVTKERPSLKAIKAFLADAGVFTDLVRREPSTVVLSGAVTPEEAIEAGIEGYRRAGKDDTWIEARIMGKLKRRMFTDALRAAIHDITQRHYALATNEIYQGLWRRTADYLKRELELPRNASLRDNQPTLALVYQAIAEEVSARRLGNKEELEWEEAQDIVREVAELIGRQARETGTYLGIDLATGKPLLPDPGDK